MEGTGDTGTFDLSERKYILTYQYVFHAIAQQTELNKFRDIIRHKYPNKCHDVTYLAL